MTGKLDDEIRKALREDEALPPGFHARARARFEAERRPGLAGFVLRYWQPLGAAAAGALALALFLPGWLADRERDLVGDSVAAATPEPPAAPAPAKRELGDEAPTVASGEELDEAGVERLQSLGDVGGSAALQEGETTTFNYATDDKARSEPQPVARQLPEETGSATEDEEASDSRLRAATEDRADELAKQKVRARYSVDAEAEARAEDDALRFAEGFAQGRPLGVALTRSAGLAPGELRVVEDAATFEGLLKRNPELERLAPDFAVHRVVLLGPHPGGVDCARAAVVMRNGTTVLVLAAGSHTGGCAILLGADGSPVVVRAP